MSRVLMWCLTIVAAFPLQLAAATPPIVHVPLTAPVTALAERLGMDVVRDRSRFVPEIIRRIYAPPSSRQVPLTIPPAPRAQADAGDGAPVDVPLSPDIWSRALFKRTVPADQLLSTILVDRRAALLCRGLLAADDDTLAFYADRPALLAFLYEHAGAFASFADSFHVRDGHFVVPGGATAAALWRNAVHADPDDADAFLRALLFEPEARFGYLYDVLATASPAARDFALGAWIDDDALRVRRFTALTIALHNTYREWHVEELPFARPLNDFAILLLRVRVGERGVPAAPAERRFWAQALNTTPALDTTETVAADAHPLIDAAWLTQAAAGDMYSRGEKLEQIAFGQRVFGRRGDAGTDGVAAIVREMPSRRMLLLGLERVGVTSPDIYMLALRQARAANEGGERFWTEAQLQGAFSIVSRMAIGGALSAADTGEVLRALFSVPLSGGDLRGQLAQWFETVLGPRLPGGDTWEARTIAAVAGGPTPGSPRIEWEGQSYHLDLAFAERRRIVEIRQRQSGPDLDLALAIAQLARRAEQATTLDLARPIVSAAQDLLAASGPMLARPRASEMAPGVSPPRDGHDWLLKAAEELDRAARVGDSRRVARAAESMAALSDVELGYTLVSLVYAIHLGDPDGPAMLGANVALRHDFGFARRDGEGRLRGPWAQPRQDFQPGVPWHVVGSLVGLDVALAQLGMHRLTIDGLPAPPRLQSIEREAFAVNVALLRARTLTNADRDRIVAAIGRGRERVRRLDGNPGELERLQADLALDGWRVRAIRWELQNAPASIENQFSLADLVILGGVEPGFDAWGASGLLSSGCLCTRFPDARLWRVLAGRVQLATMAASTVEMNLEMAQRLSALRLPAALLPSVLATAMQDFVDQADPADANDISALTRYARTIDPNVVADYVAATATLDGPLVSADADGSRQ